MMYKIVAILIGSIGIISGVNPCNHTIHQPQLRGVQINNHMEVIYPDGKLQESNTNYAVYYYDSSFEMFKYTYVHDLSNGDEINVKNVDAYLLFYRDSLNGYQFDKTETGFEEKKIPLGSLPQMIRQRFNFKAFLNRKPDTSIVDKSGVLIETYVFPPSKANPGGFIDKFYYSDNFKEYSESISKQMDSIKGRKLFKCEFVAGAYYNDEIKIRVPDLKTIYAITVVSPDNLTEEKMILNRFLELSKKE